MSEYIPRLREELVEAAARERAGQRRRLAVRPRRVAVALVAAAMLAALVVAATTIDVATDEKPVVAPPPGSTLTYRAAPVRGGDAAAVAERSAEVLRERLAAAGVANATVSVTGERVDIDADRATLGAVAALAVPGQLTIHDWEASVLGSDGRPAPAGAAAVPPVPVSQYDAVVRAAKAQAASGPRALWLVDDGAREVLAGPQLDRDALTGGEPVPDGARVLDAPSGVRVVQESGPERGRWYALADSAALSNADVARARAARDPALGDPIVAFDFTARGQEAFSSLTREIAQRGRAVATAGGDPMEAFQHLAFVLDGELVSVPFIDFRVAPNGIDGTDGAQIQGGLTDERARQIAAILNSGPLPATLLPAEEESP
jgi:preprotein translocase subunit SecD